MSKNVMIKITTQRDVIRHETEATTFGELKAELPDVKWDGMRVVERSTKATLQLDDAALPAGDFVLFVVPEKTKSGAVEQLEDIDSAGYNDLRSHISYLNKEYNANLDMSGGKEELRGRLKDWYEQQDQTTNDVADVTELVNLIEEQRDEINDSIDEILSLVSSGVRVDGDYVFHLKVKDLDKEVKEIKENLDL